MPKIFLTHVPDMLENYYGPRALAEMRKLGEVRLNTSGGVLDAKALAEAAKGCEIIVSDRQTPGPAAFFPLAPDVCAFLRVAVDIRNIDVDAASQQGVLVTRATPGFMASVSEMAIGMMIDLGRKVTEQVVDYRGGLDPEPRSGVQLHGATVGIMGYGAISRHLAPICVALGMNVLVSDPFVTITDAGVRQVDQDTLLAQSDFVVCLVIANEETENLMNAANFARMKKTAYLPQSLARQPRGRGRIAPTRWKRRHRGRRDGCRPRLRPEALAQSREPQGRDRDPAYGGPHPDAIEHQAFDTVRQGWADPGRWA